MSFSDTFELSIIRLPRLLNNIILFISTFLVIVKKKDNNVLQRQRHVIMVRMIYINTNSTESINLVKPIKKH